MNLRSLILFCFLAVLVLSSCDKTSTVVPIDTSYLDGLVGDYLIECQINYIDSNGVSQYIDTTFNSTLTSNGEDLMSLEFLDNSTIELEFTYNHQVRPGCITNSAMYYGDWMIEDNVPSFEMSHSYFECIIGFSGNSADLILFATKL